MGVHLDFVSLDILCIFVGLLAALDSNRGKILTPISSIIGMNEGKG